MLTGRVDNLVNQVLYGWAFDDSEPSANVDVIVTMGRKVIAQGVADRERPDLRANGIGEGRHAFEIPVTDGNITLEKLSVTARSPVSGEVQLKVPTETDRELEEAINKVSANMVTAISEIRDRVDQLSRIKDQMQQASAENDQDLNARLDRIEQRMEATEVFVFRLDETLKKLMEGQCKPQKRRFLFWK